MNEHYLAQLKELIYDNSTIMTALEAVRSLNLHDWYIGAGIIRTIVWDSLHDYEKESHLRDIDVIFFDSTRLEQQYEQAIQQQLTTIAPMLPFEVTNQARVHLWYQSEFGIPVQPLGSCEEAVSTWPETASSVAVRLLENDNLKIVAPCGLADLFAMIWRRNPKRVTKQIVQQRFQNKQIQKRWPKVQFIG